MNLKYYYTNRWTLNNEADGISFQEHYAIDLITNKEIRVTQYELEELFPDIELDLRDIQDPFLDENELLYWEAIEFGFFSTPLEEEKLKKNRSHHQNKREKYYLSDEDKIMNSFYNGESDRFGY